MTNESWLKTVLSTLIVYAQITLLGFIFGVGFSFAIGTSRAVLVINPDKVTQIYKDYKND